MINIDTHFSLEARHVDFSWFANTTNHDAFRTVSNLLWALPLLTPLDTLYNPIIADSFGSGGEKLLQ